MTDKKNDVPETVPETTPETTPETAPETAVFRGEAPFIDRLEVAVFVGSDES